MRFNLRLNLDQHFMIYAAIAAVIIALLYSEATPEQIDALLNPVLLALGVLAGRSIQGPRPGSPA